MPKFEETTTITFNLDVELGYDDVLIKSEDVEQRVREFMEYAGKFPGVKLLQTTRGFQFRVQGQLVE